MRRKCCDRNPFNACRSTLVSTRKGLGSSLLRVNLASKQTLGWSGYGTILRSGPLQRPFLHPSKRIPLIWHM